MAALTLLIEGMSHVITFNYVIFSNNYRCWRFRLSVSCLVFVYVSLLH